MSQKSHSDTDHAPMPRPLDLSKWRNLPVQLLIGGGLIGLLGIAISYKGGGVNFLFAYLVAFMFILSLGAGSLLMVIIHHLFDAGWSVAIRRTCENLAYSVFSILPVLFLPIAIFRTKIYPWMTMDPPDHALHAKHAVFNTPGFFIVSVLFLAVAWFLSYRLRGLSLNQDQDGAAHWTLKMRVTSCIGIFAFAFTFTFAAIMWMKALQHQWFSTMYGVHYFAGSMWLTLTTIYVITMLLDRQRVISKVMHEHQYYFLGTLIFAFTVFYAYVTFSQYFIIWNANMPEETFYYVIREKGSWFFISLVIIFGHFFLPFLVLLRIDVKSNFSIMVPVAIWAWLMHFVDMTWNVMPVHFTDGFPVGWAAIALALVAFMAGLLAIVFLKKFNSTPPFPQKDPRLIEAMGLYHPVATAISGGEIDQADKLHAAPVQPKGSH
jgi:hypothetical protein